MTRFPSLLGLCLLCAMAAQAAQAASPASGLSATTGAGVFFGVLAGTALLNLIAWVTTRRSLYGLFGLFVAASALSWASRDGLLGGFLLPAAAEFTAEISQSLLGAQHIAGSLCQIAFLSLRQRFPLLLRYYLWGGVVPGVLVMLSPWTGYYEVSSSLLFALLLPAPLLSLPAYRRLSREGDASGRILSVVLPVHFFIMWPAILGQLGLLEFEPLFADIARISALPIILALHTGIALQTRAAERARDEAQHRAAEAQKSSASERLAREERERFLSMIAHEVRTPVAVIDAAAHSLRLIDQFGNIDPVQRESRYQAIRQAVGRMRALMELTETEERLHTGAPLSHPVPLDLPAISEQALAYLEPASAVRVQIETIPPLPSLKGDARLLMFAVLNLIDNAIKYSTPETPVHISITPDAAGTGVNWRFRNAGRQIPAGNEKRLFEKYHRLDETSAQPGLGLGLPISRQIVEKHAGRLTLERSDPDWQGACFCIWLPEAA